MADLPKVRDFMTPAPVVISSGLKLAQARERMFDTKSRHLPVVDNGALVGIISDRDIAVLEAVPPAKPKDCTVREAMSPQPFSCGAGALLHAVATEMAENKYGTAVVVEPEHPSKVVGLFTTTDALRALAHYTKHLAGPEQ